MSGAARTLHSDPSLRPPEAKPLSFCCFWTGDSGGADGDAAASPEFIKKVCSPGFSDVLSRLVQDLDRFCRVAR